MKTAQEMILEIMGAGVTETALAQAIDRDQSTISRIKNGKNVGSFPVWLAIHEYYNEQNIDKAA